MAEVKARYEYGLIIEEMDDGICVAHVAGNPPLRGAGESPLQAIRALCETIREWPISGAERWLSTPEGTELARIFVPGFEPHKPGGSA